MKRILKYGFLHIVALLFIFGLVSSVSAAINDPAYLNKKKEEAQKAKEAKKQNAQPVPGFHTAYPTQEQAKEQMKKKLQAEQEANNRKAQQAIIDAKKKDMQNRGVDQSKLLKTYK